MILVINLENSVNENPVNIFTGRMKIQLPNERWSYSLQNFDQKILFHEISEITKQEKIPYWFTKQVIYYFIKIKYIIVSIICVLL